MNFQSSSTRDARLLSALVSACGPVVMEAMHNDAVVEVMANSDGTLWEDRFDCGMRKIGRLQPQQAQNIIGQVAGIVGKTVTSDAPILEAEWPVDGSRFQGLIPPLVAAPSFAIRKRPSRVFTLDEYVAAGIMAPALRERIAAAVAARQNILVAGGTGSGKTTLLNAVIAEIHARTPADRIVVIEDTREVQCVSPNKVELRASRQAGMQDLLRATLRLRPDRILVGEVRGGEALQLVKAWNTGHPGGVATLHANSAHEALQRMEDMILETAANVSRTSLAAAINVILFIERTRDGRRVREAVTVQGYDAQEQRYRLHALA